MGIIYLPNFAFDQRWGGERDKSTEGDHLKTLAWTERKMFSNQKVKFSFTSNTSPPWPVRMMQEFFNLSQRLLQPHKVPQRGSKIRRHCYIATLLSMYLLHLVCVRVQNFVSFCARRIHPNWILRAPSYWQSNNGCKCCWMCAIILVVFYDLKTQIIS
jgi:hypothetical protein